MEEKLLWGIRIARAISAIVEVTAALLLLQISEVKSMVRLNAVLGLFGPLIFITVSAFGLAAGLGKIELHRLGLVFLGVVLVVLGTR